MRRGGGNIRGCGNSCWCWSVGLSPAAGGAGRNSWSSTNSRVFISWRTFGDSSSPVSQTVRRWVAPPEGVREVVGRGVPWASHVDRTFPGLVPVPEDTLICVGVPGGDSQPAMPIKDKISHYPLINRAYLNASPAPSAYPHGLPALPCMAASLRAVPISPPTANFPA